MKLTMTVLRKVARIPDGDAYWTSDIAYDCRLPTHKTRGALIELARLGYVEKVVTGGKGLPTSWRITAVGKAALSLEQGGEAMSDPRPIDCRFRLQDEGKPYPRSACTACGADLRTLGKSCQRHPMTQSPPAGELVARLRKRANGWISTIVDDTAAEHGHQPAIYTASDDAWLAAEAITTLERERDDFREKAIVGEYMWTPAELAEFMAEKDARITTLERELEETREALRKMEIATRELINNAVDEKWKGKDANDALTASQAEVERLKEALKPFADTADEIQETVPDSDEMWENPASMNVTAGDFRRARAALQVEESKT